MLDKKHNNLIKTKCGIEKYYKLRKNQSLYGKIRLKWFIFFAVVRDFFVKN